MANPEDNGHLSQSFLLEIRYPVAPQDLETAVRTVVTRHTMLRARFKREESGHIAQFITDNVRVSYRFSWDQGSSTNDINRHIDQTQRELNASDGPVFSATVLETGQKTHLFLLAVHLVIDLVSWHIILQDLESILQHEPIHPISGTTFHEWTMLQKSEQRRARSAISRTTTQVQVLEYGATTQRLWFAASIIDHAQEPAYYRHLGSS